MKRFRGYSDLVASEHSRQPRSPAHPVLTTSKGRNMMKSRTSPARRARIGTAVFFAGLTAGALAGPGLTHAQDYPPTSPPSTETTTTIEVGAGVPGAPTGGGQQAGSPVC